MNSPDPISTNSPPPKRSYLFQPGQSGNPGGNAKGTRRRLTARFLEDLAKDYEANGKEVLEKVRKRHPRDYIAAIIKLCPRELEVSNALDDLDNDALRIVLAAAQRYVQRQRTQAIDLVPAPIAERTDNP